MLDRVWKRPALHLLRTVGVQCLLSLVCVESRGHCSSCPGKQVFYVLSQRLLGTCSSASRLIFVLLPALIGHLVPEISNVTLISVHIVPILNLHPLFLPSALPQTHPSGTQADMELCPHHLNVWVNETSGEEKMAESGVHPRALNQSVPLFQMSLTFHRNKSLISSSELFLILGLPLGNPKSSLLFCATF
jgi:hypothetical protein